MTGGPRAKEDTDHGVDANGPMTERPDDEHDQDPQEHTSPGRQIDPEATVNLTGDLEFTGDAFALRNLGGEVFEEFGVFKSEASLGGDGLEELAVSFGIGLLRAFGAEGDDACETSASG